MKRSAPLTEVIDSGAGLVRRMGMGPIAVLVLSGLPWRFGLAALASRVREIGKAASEFGPYWRDWSQELLPLFVLAVLGRLFFTRACQVNLQRGLVTWRSLIPSATTVLAVLYLALAFEILLFATAVTLLGWAIFASLQGWILASQSAFTSASPLDPWRTLSKGRDQMTPVASVDSVFAAAWGVTFLNLLVLTQFAPDLLSAVPGFNPGPARALLNLSNDRVWFGVMVGAGAAVEPFRLAALSTLFFSTHSKTSGADLQARLKDLSREEAA